MRPEEDEVRQLLREAASPLLAPKEDVDQWFGETSLDQPRSSCLCLDMALLISTVGYLRNQDANIVVSGQGSTIKAGA